MPTFAIEVPVRGATPTLTRRRQQLFARCVRQIEKHFYGYNSVIVDCKGFSQKTALAVASQFRKQGWMVSYHDFMPGDLFGRCRYLLPQINDHNPELWFYSSAATGPGFDHYWRGLTYKGLSAVCPRTVLAALDERLKKVQVEFPTLFVPTKLTLTQSKLYRQCIQELEKHYHGFNHVKVDLEGDPKDIKTVHLALMELGWFHDEGVGFRTFASFDQPKSAVPWEVSGPYLGRPAQVLAHKCALAAKVEGS